MKRPAPLNAVLLTITVFAAWPLHADSYLRNFGLFMEEVERNPVTSQAVWLEMGNAFSEWEKIILVFGYADPGDHAACEELRVLVASRNPNREYRCNPVE